MTDDTEEYNDAFAAAVREGIEAGERGALYSQEEVKQMFDKRLAPAPHPMRPESQ